MVSSTSRKASSNALAVSFSDPRSPLKPSMSLAAAVSVLEYFRFRSANVLFSKAGLAVIEPERPLITPVDCQLGAFSRIRYPSAGVALRSVREASPAGESQVTGEVV
jgi:hypothetical protein